MLKLHFEPRPELFGLKLMPVYTKSLTDLLGLVEDEPFFLSSVNPPFYILIKIN